jgi:hypothetical protein
VLQAPGTFRRGFAAFGAAFVALHAQLIFALTRDVQVRELIDNAISHSSV